MSRKYDYYPQYIEKNPNITHRKCKTCNQMVGIKKLENKYTCIPCYTVLWDKKRCSRCLMRKSTTCFRKIAHTIDGFAYKCKDCEHYKENNTKKRSENTQKNECYKKYYKNKRQKNAEHRVKIYEQNQEFIDKRKQKECEQLDLHKDENDNGNL